jgi:hypothetical protein
MSAQVPKKFMSAMHMLGNLHPLSWSRQIKVCKQIGRVTDNQPRNKLRDPLKAQWQRRRDAQHEIDHLQRQTDESILAIAHSIKGFEFLEKIYGFRVDRFNSETLQMSFGNRSMFRSRIDGKGTASETGPTLVYSLGHTGEFATILYPAKSDIARTKEDHIFIQIGETSSIKIIEGMKRDLALLVAYAHVSSIDMQPTRRESLSIWLLRLYAPRSENGEFKKPPLWRGLLALVGFGARTFTTASLLSILKPLGLAVLLALLAYFGWAGLTDLVLSFSTHK